MADIDEGRIGAIITLFIGFIVVTAVAIPVVLDMVKVNDASDPDADMYVGDRFRYTPETNIPNATVYVSGSAWDYGEWDDGEIVIRWADVGEFDLVLTAVTDHPRQEATQTIHFKIGEKDESHTSAILYIIPTVMIIGLVLFALRRVGGIGNDIDGNTRIGGGGGDMFSGGTRGFGKR